VPLAAIGQKGVWYFAKCCHDPVTDMPPHVKDVDKLVKLVFAF